MVESLLSVASQCDLHPDLVVGPMPGNLGSLDPLVLIGLRCIDVRSPSQILKVDLRKTEVSDVYCEWMLHVQSARDEHEQNLEIVAHEGRLYFRTTRPVKTDEELLVWYGTEVARALGISSPSTFLFKGDGKFSCPFCSDDFLFPNSCASHVAYRCEQRRHAIPEMRPRSESPKPTTPKKMSPASSVFTIDFLSCSSHSENGTKRKNESTEADAKKRDLKRDTSASDENDPCGPVATSSENSANKVLRQDQWGSAFKKVNKNGVQRPQDGVGTLKPLYSLPLGLSLLPTATSLAPSSLPSAFLPTNKFIHEPFVNDVIKMSSPCVSVEMAAPGRSGMYSDAHYKMPLSYGKSFAQTHASGMEKLGAPPVTTLMPPSLTALSFPAQNWCAKCNASFRMTSDLVYHMRSHHKREIDPAKKRRDEKLKCNICHESFRERHHLTRHMTSHVN
uniref:PR domain zinc finger protein 8 n=1 Tax=Strigamia maritima TaxID=126957 RepID=T1IYW7_STRMM